METREFEEQDMDKFCGVITNSVDLFTFHCAHQKAFIEEKALNNQRVYPTGQPYVLGHLSACTIGP